MKASFHANLRQMILTNAEFELEKNPGSADDAASESARPVIKAGDVKGASSLPCDLISDLALPCS